MSDKFFPDISVSEFATDILKSMSGDPKSLRPALKESSKSADVPDVSNIEVSHDYVALVTEGKKINKKPNQIKESAEDRLENLVGKLSSLIAEAKGIILEMTEVGNLGAGSSKPANPSKKLKYKILKRLGRR